MRNRLAILSLLSLCFLTGCGGGSSDGGGGGGKDKTTDFTVTVSPTTASVRTGETQQFTATVQNPVNNGVTWTVYGSGCSGSTTCGTIANGLYTAPSAVPSPATVTVLATSKDDSTKAATATVTILAGIAVSVSPVSANVSLGGTQQFTALVQNTSNTAVTWTATGSGCTGTSCGTITGDGLYTAPSSVPNPATVTITATSQADSAKSGTAVVTIGGSSLAELNGHYAFLLSGFNAGGAMHTAGSFVADGNGHLLNGLQDINGASGAHSQIAFTGTYTLGADRRGELVLTSSLGTAKFRFALNADASEARMIQFDNTGTRSSGLFARQDPLGFTNSTVSGEYVLSLVGAGSTGSRIAAVGRVSSDAAGHFSDGLIDINDGSANPPSTALWSGTYAVNSNGRGTAAMNIAGLGAINFAFYVVYTRQSHIPGTYPVTSEPAAMFMVSMDPISSATPLLRGQIYQSFPIALANYSNASWGDILRIFAMAGKVAGGGSTVLAGTFASDGAGHLQNGVFDQNRAGVITSSSNLSANYTIAPNGRGTADLPLSATQTTPVTFYLITGDRSVWMASAGADVLAGFQWLMAPGGAPNDNSVFSGDYVSGPFALPSPEMMMFSGSLYSDGVGHFSGTQDIHDIGGQSVGEPIGGTYAFGLHGRATGNLSDGSAIVLYMLGLDSEIALSVDPGDENPMVLIIKR
ncbi:MAG: hypothetical protein ROO76_23060 [Terriglobia bacterium]|jgi:hypothetical protein|nr:hypothetical protein [Terriglobia bacterium]